MANTELENIDLRGFLVPDTRFSLQNLDAETSANQVNGQAGRVIPQEETDRLVLEASGQQDASWEVSPGRGGHPGNGLSLVWREAGSTEAQDWRGWNSPNMLFNKLINPSMDSYNGGVAFLEAYRGRLFWGAFESGTLPDSIRTCELDLDDHTFNTVGFVANSDWGSSANLAAASCATWQTDSGNIRMFYSNPTANYAVILEYDYESETWELLGRPQIDGGGLFDPDTYIGASGAYTADAAAYGDEVCLLYVTGAGELKQLASNDGGLNWTLISEDSSTTWDNPQVVVTKTGRFLLMAADSSTVELVRASSAYEDRTTLTATLISNAPDYAAVIDDDNNLYVFSSHSTLPNYECDFSADEGENMRLIGSADILTVEDTTNIKYKFRRAVSVGGSIYVFTTFENPSDSSRDGVPFILQYGGYSNVEQTGALGDTHFMDQIPFGANGTQGRTYLVNGFPDDPVVGQLWTLTGATLPTLDPGYRLTFAGGAYTTYYTWNGSPNKSSWGWITVQCDATTSHTSKIHFLRLQTGANNANDYQVEVWFGDTGFSIVDVNAASIVESVSVDLTSPMQFLFYMPVENGDAQIIAYKRPYESKWTIHNNTGWTNAAAGALGHTVEFGHNSGTSGDFHVEALVFGIPGDLDGESTLGIGRDGGLQSAVYPQWDVAKGKPIGAYPYPFFEFNTPPVVDGVPGVTYLRAPSGPGGYRYTQDSRPTFTYGYQNIFHEVNASPAAYYDADSTSAQTFVWDFGTPTRPGNSSSMAIAVLNAQIASFKLEYWDGATYQTVATSATDLTGLSFDLEDDGSGDSPLLQATSATATIRYLKRGELVGGVIEDSGVEAEILEQSEGYWGDASSDSKKPLLRLDSELTTPFTGATIYPPNQVLIIHNQTVQADKWRLTLTPLSTIPLRVGQVLIGGLVIPGRQWSNAYIYKTTPNVRFDTREDGTELATRLGSPKREWTLSWTDLHGLHQFQGAYDDSGYLGPNYFTARDGASYPAVANRNDVGWTLEGMLEELNDGANPVIALATIPRADAIDDYETITDPDLFLYGYLKSPISIEHNIGDVERGEVVRVQQIKIEEIL